MMAATIAGSGPTAPELVILIIVSAVGIAWIVAVLRGGRRK